MERTQAVQKRCEHGNTVDSLRCEPQCPHSSAALIAAMLRKKGLEQERPWTLAVSAVGGGSARAIAGSAPRATQAPTRGQGASLSFLSKPRASPRHLEAAQARRTFWGGVARSAERHSPTMTSIEKLSIKGIRSFSPNTEQVIEFHKPLTVYAAKIAPCLASSGRAKPVPPAEPCAEKLCPASPQDRGQEWLRQDHDHRDARDGHHGNAAAQLPQRAGLHQRPEHPRRGGGARPCASPLSGCRRWQ